MATVRPMTKTVQTKPARTRSAQTRPAQTRSAQTRSAQAKTVQTKAAQAKTVPLPAPKVPLPAGQPREWYETHNRQLKAMRLAIALLDSGVYTPDRATDQRISGIAARVGVRPPSRATCRLVRSLLPAARHHGAR